MNPETMNADAGEQQGCGDAVDLISQLRRLLGENARLRTENATIRNDRDYLTENLAASAHRESETANLHDALVCGLIAEQLDLTSRIVRIGMRLKALGYTGERG